MNFPVVPLAFQRSVKIDRRQTGSYVNHRYTEPAAINNTLIGSVQPLNAKELKSAPEGEEVTEGIKIYTADANGVKNTDIIKDGGESYRVFSVKPWQRHGHRKVMAGLINV